jgi:hypothetical protein
MSMWLKGAAPAQESVMGWPWPTISVGWSRKHASSKGLIHRPAGLRSPCRALVHDRVQQANYCYSSHSADSGTH